MLIRIANHGNIDLLIQSSGGPTKSLRPLTEGEKIDRQPSIEYDLGDNEILILRRRGAKDPEGIEIRSAV